MKHLYLLLFSVGLLAQSQKEIYLASTKAYQDKDYPTFLKLTEQLDSVRPSHPAYSYYLACAYALNNKEAEAITQLKKCLLANVAIPFENEADLSSILNTKEYGELIALKKNLNETVANSEKFVVLSERDLHPESLLYLKKSKTWLANSIRNKKIVSFDEKSGKCTDWFLDPSLYAVFTMKADKEEKFLWITTTAIPEMRGYNLNLEGKTEILKIEIKTKKVIKRFSIQGNHVFGDLIINDKAEVFLSDSVEAVIYTIKNEELAIWLDLKKEAFNLQGITFDNEQNEIFIADYLKGVLKINVKNPSDRHWIRFPEDISQKGIDGLTYFDKSLIVLQNGVKPHRVTQLFLNDDYSIANYKIIDHNRSEMIEPTNGIIKGNDFYFIGNSPWSFYDKNLNLNADLINYPTIYKYNLHAN